MAIFTVKMRASQQGRHTSGAEKTTDEDGVRSDSKSKRTRTRAARFHKSKNRTTKSFANRFSAGAAGN